MALNPPTNKPPANDSPSKRRRKFRVQQAIFTGAAAADGAHLTFASLSDGRCALLREGVLVAAWGSDVYGVDVGVRRFLVETAGAAAAAAVPAASVRSHARSQRKTPGARPAPRDERVISCSAPTN